MKWDGRLLRRVFGAVLVLSALFGGIAAADVNQTVGVHAKGQDNPQANASDLEGNFTNAPNANKDEIHVLNNNIKGEGAGVYNDPVHDGALLTITQDSGPVKVEVEGREGIGAIYWVSVKATDNGGVGGGGGNALLWADVKDVATAGALVLKDTNGGKGTSDATDTDSDTPTLTCELAPDGKGDVEFWLEAGAGTYDWQIIQGGSALVSGTLAATSYRATASDLDPGEYTLSVTKAGDAAFKRKINFIAASIDIVWGASADPTTDSSNQPVNTGTVITDKSCYTVVGSMVSFGVTITPATTQPVSYQWTIPGGDLGSQQDGVAVEKVTYTPSPMPAGVVPNPTSIDVVTYANSTAAACSPTNPTQRFFWSSVPSGGASANQVVKCKVTIGGKSTTVQTTMVLEKPAVTVTSPPIAPVSGPILLPPATGITSPVMQCGDWSATPIVIGMIWTRAWTEPTHHPAAGTVQWVQTFTHSKRRWRFTGTFGNVWWAKHEFASGYLDTTFPYPVSGIMGAGSAEDSPYIGQATWTDTLCDNIEVDEIANMYLMYRPAGTFTEFVPVHLTQWNWEGKMFRGAGNPNLVATWTMWATASAIGFTGTTGVGWPYWEGNTKSPPRAYVEE